MDAVSHQIDLDLEKIGMPDPVISNDGPTAKRPLQTFNLATGYGRIVTVKGFNAFYNLQ